MKYVLKNKDKIILEFEVIVTEKEFEDIGKATIANIVSIKIFKFKAFFIHNTAHPQKPLKHSLIPPPLLQYFNH